MSEALATLFEGKEIRVVEYSGEMWMPCKDLGLSLGVNRSTLYHHVKRNRDFFGDDAQDGDKLSPDDGDLWVNEEGLYTLLARISVGRVTPSAKEAIIKFRKSVPELIQKYRKKEIVQVPQKADIRTELLQAKEYADICGKAPESFQAKVFQKHGMPEFADALQPPAPALVHGSTGWFIPTQLGEMCGLTAEQFNHWLHNNPNDPERRPFQCRDPENRKVWRLTELGWLHGQEYWFEAPSGHREIRIRWRESILYASGLKREIPASQLMLPARA